MRIDTRAGSKTFSWWEIIRTCIRCKKVFGEKIINGCGMCDKCHEDVC